MGTDALKPIELPGDMSYLTRTTSREQASGAVVLSLAPHIKITWETLGKTHLVRPSLPRPRRPGAPGAGDPDKERVVDVLGGAWHRRG